MGTTAKVRARVLATDRIVWIPDQFLTLFPGTWEPVADDTPGPPVGVPDWYYYAEAAGAVDDDIIAGRVTDADSATFAALAARFVASSNPTAHAPALGLYFPEAEGATGGTDDTAAMQATFTAARAANGTVALRPGRTYTVADELNPTGTRVLMHYATIKLKAGITAPNLFEPTGDFEIVGGTLDGNKANNTDPANVALGCAVRTTSTTFTKAIVRDVFVKNFHSDGLSISGGSSITDAANAATSPVTVEGVTVTGTRYGIYLNRIKDATVRNCVADSNTIGINLNLCRSSTVSGSKVRSNSSHGILAAYCRDIAVTNNPACNNNGGAGICLGGGLNTNTASLYGTISGNVCNSNGSTGITLDLTISGASGVSVPWHGIVSGNTCIGNTGDGITCTNTSHVGFTGNNCHANTSDGLQVNSGDCTIAGNHFTDNSARGLSTFIGSSTDRGNLKIGVNTYDGNTLGDYHIEAGLTGVVFSVEQSGSPISGATSSNPVPSDHGLLGWAYDPAVTGTAGSLLAAGDANVVSVKVPAGSITSLLLYVTVAGASLTSGQCFAALYQNGVRLGVTADQATAWQSTGLKTMAIAGGPVTVAAGTVQVVFWSNGTTQPTILRGANLPLLVNAGLGTSASRFGTANTGLTTTGPNPLGTITARGNSYWAAVA